MRPLFRYVLLSITGAGCKNRCKHCSVDASVSEPTLIAYDLIEEVVELLKAENEKSPPLYEHVNPSLMHEPMDYPDIVRVQELFYDLDPEASLVRTMATNGQRIAEDADYARLIRDLQDRGVRQFQITLHGLEKTHDWFAGRRGAYASIMEAARRLACVGAKVEWVYFLSKKNLAEFPQMIQAARDASSGTAVSDGVNIWGPAGRGGRQSRLLVTSEDLEMLPADIRKMEFLPQYLPECTWVQYASSGEMHSMLRDFRSRARQLGGIPECSFRIDRHNITDFPKMLEAQRRLAADRPQQPEPKDPAAGDLQSLAETYGDSESGVLYRVSTMHQEWRRREREDACKLG